MDVNQFVQKQLEQLEEIQKNVCYVPEEDQVLIGRLKFTQYEGFNGKIMDHLWTSVMETTEKKQTQEETAEFIRVKEDEVKGISEHFYSLNHMDFTSLQHQ